MKKLRIVIAIVLMAIIPASLYIYGVHGSYSGGGHSGGGRSFTSGARSTGSISTMRTRSMTAGRTVRPSTRATTLSRSNVQRRGTKVGGDGRGGGRDGRRGGRHGDHWGHRGQFRHYPGNFWRLGIGYPWWWYTYPHICVDEFGFEYNSSFCYAQPSIYFWWYR